MVWGAIKGAIKGVSKFATSPLGSLLGSAGSGYGYNEMLLQNQNLVNAFNAEQALLQREFEANQAGITRDWTSDEAHTARMFNRREAWRQRDWQRRMSSTAIRRQMRDMRRGGLNPILAGKYGGAPVGSGATASSGIPTTSSAKGAAARGVMANLHNIGGEAIQRFNERKQLQINERSQFSQSMLQGAQAAKALAEAGVPAYQINKLISDIRVNSSLSTKMAQETLTETFQQEKIYQEIEKIQTSADYDRVRTRLEQQNINLKIFDERVQELVNVMVNDGVAAAYGVAEKFGVPPAMKAALKWFLDKLKIQEFKK